MLTQAIVLPLLQTLQTDLEKEIHTDTPCKSARLSWEQLERMKYFMDFFKSNRFFFLIWNTRTHRWDESSRLFLRLVSFLHKWNTPTDTRCVSLHVPEWRWVTYGTFSVSLISRRDNVKINRPHDVSAGPLSWLRSAANLPQCRREKPQRRWEVSTKHGGGGRSGNPSAMIRWGVVMGGEVQRSEQHDSSWCRVGQKASVVKQLIGKLQQKSNVCFFFF